MSAAARRRNIVVFFNARGSALPLRTSNAAHLAAWGRHARNRVIYVNVTFGVPWWLLRRAGIDAVVFDTLFCSMHWTPDNFAVRAAECLPVAALQCPKIAIVQDEFFNIDLVADFLGRIGVTHLLTCSKEADWAKFYPRLDRSKVSFRTVLTGYVDDRWLTAKPHYLPPAKRPIAIGYRGGNNPFWLGSHGLLKQEVSERVHDAAVKAGFAADIQAPDGADYLKGGQWFDFLGSCRAVIGVEGGASINDHDGTVRAAVDAYLALHPGASFAAVRDACFPGRDGEVDLSCLSPRHFEAAITRTAQLLHEGHYSGVFEPWRHYIPLKADYSNMDAALAAVMDDTLVDAMTERAYSEIVASSQWSYRRFIRELETDIMATPSVQPQRLSLVALAARTALSVRAAILWQYAGLEAQQQFADGLASLARIARVFERIPATRSAVGRVRRIARRIFNLPQNRA